MKPRDKAFAAAGAISMLLLLLMLPSAGSGATGHGSDGAAIEIVVKGETCQLGDGPTGACPEICAGLSAYPHDTPILIRAELGMHGTVEALKGCIAKLGFTNVRVTDGETP